VRAGRRLLGLALVALALAGCAGAGPTTSDGSARLWVTRERGDVLLVDARVAAGQTLLRALRSQADVDTRYGGRFVQGIDGLEGDVSAQRDWFWFVNGLAGDRSAAEYRLRDGDVAWWDYRDWADDAEELQVVVGAFPEPFLHGYDGRVRPSVVRYGSAVPRTDAERVGAAIAATSVAPLGTPEPAEANVLRLVGGAERFRAELEPPGGGPSAAVVMTFSGDVDDLLAGPAGPYARRFEVP
jgi:hypothetical protein